MYAFFQSGYLLGKNTIRAFFIDNGLRKSAALAYYTVFALPGVLIIVLSIASVVFDTRSVEITLVEQITFLLGRDAAQTIETIIEHISGQTPNLSLAALSGFVALLFGATGAFAELQSALNEIWGIRPETSGRNSFWLSLKKRLLSFGTILSLGFILLVSLTISTILSMLGKRLNVLLPDPVLSNLLNGAEFVFSVLIIALLFAALFKILPDASVSWKDVSVGAIATALMFSIGKELIGFYLGNSNVGSAFGAASSLVVLLVWVYFSAFVVFLGAEFTQQWIQHKGRKIKAVKQVA